MNNKLIVKINQHDDFVVMYTEGYINNIGGEEISRQFKKLYDDGVRKFILNLESSSIINSIGISILIEIIEQLVAEKGKIYFCNLTPVISRTFEIMGLAQYAKIFQTEEEAVKEIQQADEY